MLNVGKLLEEKLRPSEMMALWGAEEAARTERGRLHDALVLPDHDAAHTGPGHAPASSVFGDYGPTQPSAGARNGDVLGSTLSVLNVSTCAKNIEECKKYIQLGCDVNATDSSGLNSDTLGWTPLHFAARWDRLDVIDMLLQNGADPLARSWDEVTPMVLARRLGNYAAFRKLEAFIKTGQSDQHAVVSPHKQGQSIREEEAVHYLDPDYSRPVDRRPQFKLGELSSDDDC